MAELIFSPALRYGNSLQLRGKQKVTKPQGTCGKGWPLTLPAVPGLTMTISSFRAVFLAVLTARAGRFEASDSFRWPDAPWCVPGSGCSRTEAR